MTNPMLAELDEVVRLINQYDSCFDDEERAAIGAKEDTLAVNFLRTHHDALADMAKRLEAAERDAARIDWLESKAHMLTWNDNGEHVAIRAEDGAEGTGESWREAIDAAIDATQEGEG